MKLSVDTETGIVTRQHNGRIEHAPLYSPAAFSWLSSEWLKVGWVQKHTYTFTWLGRPIVQLPEDLLRLQELIVSLQPDLIIETGIAHGGGLVFYASLCKLLGRGRVIGIDVDIRSHNRAALQAHPLFPLITLIEGSSTDGAIVERVRSEVHAREAVLVVLDSCHTKQHVLDELRAYAPMVTLGSYIVAMDGIMKHLAGAPRTNDDWSWNNPQDAVQQFLGENRDFALGEPPFAFSESDLAERVTYSPNGFLRRVSHSCTSGAGS